MNKITRSTFILWAIFLLIVCISTLLTHRTVTTTYLDGALNWLNGQNLYASSGLGGFVYLPQAAILYIPFSFMPFWLAEILWRVLSIGLFSYGIYRFSLLENRDRQQWTFLIITIVTLILGFSSARNGQSTIILIAMMLFAVCAISAERWRLAAFYLVLGLAFKPIIIVFLLLTGAVYRPLRIPLSIGLMGVILFPFLTQNFSYVIEQYQQNILMLKRAEEFGTTIKLSHWAHFFAMLSQFNIINTPPNIQFGIKAVMAIVTLWTAYYVKNKFSKTYAIILIYTLATTYLLLFSSRTENNTYVMLAPVLGFFIAESVSKKHFRQLGFLLFISLGIAGSYTISKILTSSFNSWVAPLMTCFFVFYLIYKIVPTLFSHLFLLLKKQ